MKRLLNGLVTLVLLGLLVVVAGVAWVYLSSERRFSRRYDVPARELEVPALQNLDRGSHLATIWGCNDCHGPDLAGRVVIDGPAMRLVAPNVTGGSGSPTADYESRDWARAIRHGVRPDGMPLIFMPAQDYYPMSNDDLGALVAYLESVPPVDRDQPATVVRGLGRFLFVTGRLPLVPAELIDHEAPRPVAPPMAETAAYGAYLAHGCQGCHGEGLAGGPVPGAPPDWPAAPDLTPGPQSGLAGWGREDFVRALR